MIMLTRSSKRIFNPSRYNGNYAHSFFFVNDIQTSPSPSGGGGLNVINSDWPDTLLLIQAAMLVYNYDEKPDPSQRN